MRNRFLPLPIALLLVSVTSMLFQNCVKDNCTSTYNYWVPVYKTKAAARANIKNNPSKTIQQPGKIYVRGNYIFLNEIDKGIHIIDNTNPSDPKNIAFIDIPGNMDMAVKGDMLYADFYSDLVAINISDPMHIAVTKFTENMFPQRTWGNGFIPSGSQVIVDWVEKDTTVAIDCGGSNEIFTTEKRSDFLFISMLANGLSNSSAATSPFGMGGSMARFTIVNNYLYAVSSADLNIVSINNPAEPVFNNKVNVGMGIETIYPFSNRLFIGSTSGMFIYDIANPVIPAKLGAFSHVQSCDPVIADNNNAFVTLRSGNSCQGFTNQLDVLDITNLNNPVLQKTYPMKNPHGLAKDQNTLIICDGTGGVKFYNAANSNDLTLLKTISNIEAYDVIAANKWVLVVAKDGLYQYDYSSLTDIRLLSKLTIN